MKWLLLLLLIPSSLQAQVDSSMVYRQRYAGILNQASHSRMVWFTNQHIDVNTDFSVYLQMNKDYYMDSPGDNFYKEVYRKRYAGNPKDKPGPVYVVYDVDKEKYINKVTITGPWGQIAELFVSYWEKPFHLQEKRHVKGEVAWLNSFGDRVSFYNDGATGAKIIITPNETTQRGYYHYVIR